MPSPPAATPHGENAPEAPAGGSFSFPAPAPPSAPILSTVQEPESSPIPNGGFDESSEGWRGSNSALSLVRGVTGNAVRVRRANSRAFAIVAGKPVASARAGARYRAGAFVRTVTPGMFVCLRVDEFARGARMPVTHERCAAATTAWQRLKVDMRTTSKGTRLVFSVRVLAALGGTSFDVDGFRLS